MSQDHNLEKRLREFFSINKSHKVVIKCVGDTKYRVNVMEYISAKDSAVITAKFNNSYYISFDGVTIKDLTIGRIK